MIRNIQRRWFEVWGAEEAQNRFLKYLLLIFCFVSVAELAGITMLAARRPILIAVSAQETRWNGPKEPDSTLLMQELVRATLRYLKTRHNWEWNTIDASVKGAVNFVAPEFREKFQISLGEQVRLAKEKQVSQKLYPDEPQVDLNTKKVTISAERILIVNGLRASQPMTFELGFEFGDRTESNPEGIYITSEKVNAPN
jgi:hypothetical protein